MSLKFISLVSVVLLCSGCAYFQGPDFDKPLITLPPDTCSANPDNKENRPPQQEAWVEAKTSRIWVSPHIDQNGDYVEGYYKYIVIKPGHWSLNGT